MTTAPQPEQVPGDGPRLITVDHWPIEKLKHFAEGGYLYAVLDATDQPKVPQKAEELGEERAMSLFVGTSEQEFWAVAPYLVRIDAETLEWLFSELGTAPWGVFLMSKAELSELYTHLQRFLFAQLPDGTRWFFRYYDPRILEVFLPGCSAEELADFFGPVRAFGIVKTEPLGCMVFMRAVQG